MAKRYTNANPTANAAIGRTDDSDAERMRRNAAAREAADANRNAAIARRKAAAQEAT